MVRNHGFSHGWNARFRHGHSGDTVREDAIYTASSPAVILQSVHLFQNHCKFFVIAETIVCIVSLLNAHH